MALDYIRTVSRQIANSQRIGQDRADLDQLVVDCCWSIALDIIPDFNVFISRWIIGSDLNRVGGNSDRSVTITIGIDASCSR